MSDDPKRPDPAARRAADERDVFGEDANDDPLAAAGERTATVPPPHPGGEPEDEQPRESQPETLADPSAPWVGAEEQWRKSLTGDLPVDDKLTAADSVPPDEPLDSVVPPPADDDTQTHGKPSIMPAPTGKGYRTALQVVVPILAVLLIGALALAFDQWDENEHLRVTNEQIAYRLDARERQVTRLRDAYERRIGQLGEDIALYAADNDPISQARADQLREELTLAQTGMAIASEEPAEEPLEEAEEGPTDPAEEAEDEKDEEPSSRDRKRDRGEGDEPAEKAGDDEVEDNPYGVADDPYGGSAAPAPAAPAPKPAPKPAGGGRDELDDLLAGGVTGDAVSRTEKARKAGQRGGDQPAAGGGLPEQPTKDEVRRAMTGVAGNIRRCGRGAGGKILLKITVSGPSGRVMRAEVAGSDHRGDEIGLCAMRMVRRARFPRFRRNSLVIKYPFDL